MYFDCVYEKLQVRGRLEAVAKARDRGVLSFSIGTTAPGPRVRVAIEFGSPSILQIARMWTPPTHADFVRPKGPNPRYPALYMTPAQNAASQ